MNKIFAFLLFASCSTYGMEEKLNSTQNLFSEFLKQALQWRNNNPANNIITNSDVTRAIEHNLLVTKNHATLLQTLSNLTGISQYECDLACEEAFGNIITSRDQN